MPRSRGSSSRSSRPAAPASSRSSSTMAAPAPSHAPPAPPKTQAQAGPQQPGMLGQMAATAGSVAAGSVIGHGISSMLFGGRGEAAPAAQQTTNPSGSCEFQAKEFTKCLDAAGDVQTCQWFLDQLKACQTAASKY